MTWQNRYETSKQRLLKDASICKENRKIFAEFFEFEEYKLKRRNQLARLDNACYKTLYLYTINLRNANRWFNNKPWKGLVREDIKRVYDDLEDGRIKNARGKSIADRASYYNKIFKSKPFRIVGKAELAKDVIEFYTRSNEDVRFVTEETFRKMIAILAKPQHLLLFWLAWDLGENIDALLKLTKRDFTRQKNPHTHEAEYLVNLAKGKIKRSRRTRSEPTLYPETVRYADIVLETLQADERLFPFGYHQALKVMRTVVKKTGATCQPVNEPVRWKDLRSGMACHLLKNGWTREEVDARLGHTPNSSALNAYLNYLAIDRQKPKKRLFDSSLEQVQSDLEEARRREKLHGERLERQAEENRELRDELKETQATVRDMKKLIEIAMRKLEGPETQKRATRPKSGTHA
ncbi:MAG: hypothetical protein FLDDKLPJ_03621 [Phycisphaerae bacterium]|nr:hypothetical protein [Phycisphaerae bacterium]